MIKKSKPKRPLTKLKRKVVPGRPRPPLKKKRRGKVVPGRPRPPLQNLGPNLTIKIEPEQSRKATFLPLAPNASNKYGSIKIVFRLAITHKEKAVSLLVNRITFSFPNSTHSEIIMKDRGFGKDFKLKKGKTTFWSNRRTNLGTKEKVNWHNNAIYLPTPAPKFVRVNVYCKGWDHSATKLVKLAGHRNSVNWNSYSFPFSAQDLHLSEFCVTSADHWATGGVGATQMFAHDIGVESVNLKSKKWTSLKAHTNASKNNNGDYRLFGLPVRAMANGTVEKFLNTMKDNTKMGKQKPTPSPVSGNFLLIKHGRELVTYAHFKKGSIPKSLLKKGARVKEGQIIGLGGNSGNSTGPHLHIAGVYHTGELRPFLFRNAWSIQKNDLSKGSSLKKWTELKGHGIPKEKTAILPTSKKWILRMMLHIMSNS